MSELWKRVARRWQDDVNLVLGVWLFLSPWLLLYGAEQATAAWNAHVVGIVIAALSLAALVIYRQWEEWLAVLFAAWLIVSPWILGYGAFTTAIWNQIVVGIVVLVLALWSAYAERREHKPA